MKSSIRLDSAVFQLTPTRTRCDLVISANGKTEKLASGLLNPFLAHLKAAQEQMAKGGYSIILEPSSDASWFTKGTVERFVRFVSTPEVLERVYTLESEILQIEEAIAIQGNGETAPSAVEESPVKPMESTEGSRTSPDASEEKAIVLYKPGANPSESNGSTSRGENSKVQLLKVLETRKTVLQKEQGMAFARAVAAGFDIDNIPPLVSFSECFGASRLRDACKRFKELWKKKHETGQWVEIEAAEAISSRSDFSAMNASGIMLSSVANAEISSESNGKSSSLTSTDEKASSEHQPPPGHPEYFQGHFSHQMFPPWPIQSPPGTVPVFQPYPMQGMPYYQNYPGAGPFFQPPYPAVDDPRLNPGLRMVQKRHSMDSTNGNTELETWEMDAHRTRSLDEADFEKESHKKGNRSGKKKSGVVVIRNINYITSKGQKHSDDESQSASESEADEEDGSGSSETKHNNSLRSSKKKNNHVKAVDDIHSAEKEADGGHWQAFQNFLLRDADEDKHSSDQGMFSMENKVHSKRRQNKVGGDPILFGGQDAGESHNGGMDMRIMSGNTTRIRRTSMDEAMTSKKDGLNMALDGQEDVLSSEINGKRLAYRRSTNDDVVINRQSGFTGSPSDPLVLNGFDGMRNNADRRSSNNMDDDSYIVSLQSTSPGQGGNSNRNAVDMDSELPLANQKAGNRAGNQANYEPEELSMMPQRGVENGAIGYDPALDYENAEDNASRTKKNKESVTENKQGSKKLPDKGPRSRLLPDDKKKNVGPIRRGKPSKMSPLDEARVRAEKVRTFKADLQKMKKEKEEAEMKRLEGLKMERQKRIAARGGSTLPAQPSRKQVPMKTSSSSLRGSKFSDSETGSTSPLQRYPARTASVGSNDSQKMSKTSRLNGGSLSAGNRLSRSATSLPAPKKESNGVASETKAASMARIRRLSEPKLSSHPISLLRARSTEPVSKSKASDGSEVKKISAIVNYDKSKAATLPELKIRTPKGLGVSQSKSTTKEAPQKGNSVKSLTTSEGAEAKKNDEKISQHSEGDENPIVEKSVVMLEEKLSIPAVHASEGNSRAENKHNDNLKIRENTTGVLDYAVIRAPASKIASDIVGGESIENQIKKQTTSYEVSMGDARRDLPQVSSVDVAQNTYQAPYARASSFEDPCTEKSEYGKVAPTNLEPVTTSSTSVRAQVFDSRGLKLEKIPEIVEKPQGKESSKGFRRLLKFGRKSNTSGAGEHNSEMDHVSINGSEADDNGTYTVVSSEVHTLKNLISQDETPAEATPQKSSRHFSLLSPFRSKTSEKKATA